MLGQRYLAKSFTCALYVITRPIGSTINPDCLRNAITPRHLPLYIKIFQWFPFLSVINLSKIERFRRTTNRATTGSLSSFPIPLPLSETSLLSLRVTLTHFAMFSCKRALCFPNSFSISGLIRLGSETKTFRVFLESFCVHSPTHAFCNFC